MNICIRLLIPGIVRSGIPPRSKELHSATASRGGRGIGEFDGALSGAGGDSESEKGLDVLGSINAGDLGVGG